MLALIRQGDKEPNSSLNSQNDEQPSHCPWFYDEVLALVADLGA
jgi:hypothetical protein